YDSVLPPATGYSDFRNSLSIAISSSVFIRAANMKKIWLTTDGQPLDSILGVFASEAAAARYRDQLVERYSLGRNLSLYGKPLAQDAGAWQLGLGPSVVERAVDDSIEFLRGAWVVKVDE